MGNIYYINKANVGKTRKSLAWNPDEKPEETYTRLTQEVAKVLNLSEINFNASVEDWNQEDADI